MTDSDDLKRTDSEPSRPASEQGPDEPVQPAEPAGDNADASETTNADAAPARAPVDTDPAAHDDLELTDGEDEHPDEDATERGDPWGGHAPETVKRILEAGLFAAGTALSVSQLAALFEEHERPHRPSIRGALAELMERYQGGGFELVEVASGYRFQTQAEFGRWVSRLWEERPQRYSRALLETLALIAYRQPITRGEIEEVRGVSVSSSIIKTLQEREWVRVVGHRDVPGRPAMYATTRQMLDYFGLRSLDQLPSLGDILDMEDIHPELDLNETDRDGAGAVDDQAEISFSSMVDKLREGERSGKTGNEFIDDQLDSQLTEMDAVNEAIEQAFESQRAEHNQPGLDLNEDGVDDDNRPEPAADDAPETPATEAGQTNDAPADGGKESAGSEAEKWRIIQEKLAQQQALLDARESDRPGGDDNDEQ